MADFVPSKYQIAVRDAVLSERKNVLVSAAAGSGKSSTIEWVISQLPRGEAVLALAFNKHIQLELEKRLPQHVQCRTLNGLGHRAYMGFAKGVVLDDGKVRKIVRDVMGRSPDAASVTALVTKAKVHGLAPNGVPGIQGLMDDTNANWAFLADEYGIDLPILAFQREAVLSAARAVLTRSVKETKLIDFADQMYMTVLYGCTMPKYDRVFVDEAQDLSGIQIEMIRRCAKPNTQMIFVGDRSQCQPAGTKVTMWDGRIKNIEDLAKGDKVASFNRASYAVIGGRPYSGKGRECEGYTVSEIGSRHYQGAMLAVKVGTRSTEATPDHTWLARWSDRTVDWCVTYLMRRGDDFRVGWCKLFRNTPYQNHFFHRCLLEKADEGWILAVHKNRSDASMHESYVAANFGLSTATFEPIHGANHYTKDRLDHLFSLLRPEAHQRANKCLESFGRDIRYGFYAHNPARTRTTLFEVKTCNLLPEVMSLPIAVGEKLAKWEKVTEVTSRPYHGMVHSMNVDTGHTYVADDGIITHNCIYKFRGADPRSMDKIKETFNCAELPLSISYRCPKRVVEIAQRYDPTIEAAPTAIEGTIEHRGDALSAPYQVGDMVLCRYNAPLLKIAYSLISRRIAVTMVGRDIAVGLKALLQKIGGKTPNEILNNAIGYQTRQMALMEENCESPEKIESLVDRIEAIRTIVTSAHNATTVSDIENEIEALFTDKDRCVKLSSIHRAKGLETHHVYIVDHDVVRRRSQSADAAKQETNARYIAVTRAQKALYFVSFLSLHASEAEIKARGIGFDEAHTQIPANGPPPAPISSPTNKDLYQKAKLVPATVSLPPVSAKTDPLFDDSDLPF